MDGKAETISLPLQSVSSYCAVPGRSKGLSWLSWRHERVKKGEKGEKGTMTKRWHYWTGIKISRNKGQGRAVSPFPWWPSLVRGVVGGGQRESEVQIAGNVPSRCGTEQSANKIGRFFKIINLHPLPYGTVLSAESVPNSWLATPCPGRKHQVA